MNRHHEKCSNELIEIVQPMFSEAIPVLIVCERHYAFLSNGFCETKRSWRKLVIPTRDRKLQVPSYYLFAVVIILTDTNINY